MAAERSTDGTDARDVAIALVADDDPSVRHQLKAALEGRFRVVEARNGRDALRAIAALPALPALAILDVVMPVVGGLEVIAHLHRLAPKLPIVAIACDGPASADLLEVAAQLGAGECLVKPVAPAALARLADKLLAA
jgi:CheY-like chemotaxis protein